MKPPKPKKRGRPIVGKVSQKAMAAAAGVTVKTLLEWRKLEGLDITDKAAVLARAETARRKEPEATAKATTQDTGESYSEARRRREIAAANRMEIIAQREAGKLVDIDVVKQSFTAVGAAVKGRLLAMRGNLVPELHGKTEAGIYKVLDDRIHEVLEELYQLSKIPKS
jgi:hypothetical protein